MHLTLSPADVARLRAALAEAGYTVDAVVARMGTAAHAALARNATVPGVRALGEADDSLAVLTRLWLLQRPVPTPAVRSALDGVLDALIAAGLLAPDQDGRTCALVDVRPYAADDGVAGWVVADLTPNLDTATAPVRPDWVLGVSPASTSLAQLTLRRPVRRALDLGTGCGVQSLHLARHTDAVVATDVNPRALRMARLTADLNEVPLDLRQGSLYEPVAGERFDLVTTNPPYVMSPPRAEGERLTYREGGFTGDGLVARVVREGTAHLADDGVLQVLGNWAHLTGTPWQERLAGWLAPAAGRAGCDAHVVQREVLGVEEYVELWLADAGLAGSPTYRQRYAEWCDYFAALGVEAVGMGWLTVHAAGRAQPRLTVEHWPYPLEQPIAPAELARIEAVEREARLDDDALLARCWRLAGDVVQETTGPPGEADPEHLVLRAQRGFRRAVAADTALAGVLGACDGDLPLGRIVDAVAGLLALDAGALRAELVPRLRPLVVDGFLR